jgi:cellulose synthase/poly-beta-1,6-N-acetylglucosamine synthase-like glycosyltransferase
MTARRLSEDINTPAGAVMEEAETQQIRCSLGIMAHNEEANVGRLLEAIVSQRTKVAALAEIIVIASGCTDGTEDIVNAWAARDPRIRLIVQPQREGKASAVNRFLSEAGESVLVVSSADLLPAGETIEYLIAPFADPEIAMTSCRPVPVNDPGSFMGFAAHFLWNLHHLINLSDFKAGELIAFRKVFMRIPYSSAVDEAAIESVIRGQGYTVRYVENAITYNKGPDTVRDFLRQRRRIYSGHLMLRDTAGYRVATLSSRKLLGLALRHMDWHPRALAWTWAIAGLEMYGRVLGVIDYKRRRNHTVWDIAGSTKQLGDVYRSERTGREYAGAK